MNYSVTLNFAAPSDADAEDVAARLLDALATVGAYDANIQPGRSALYGETRRAGYFKTMAEPIMPPAHLAAYRQVTS
jgi:hypothetical protein